MTRTKMDETSLNTFCFGYVDLELNVFCSDHYAYTKLLCIYVYIFVYDWI